MPNQFKKELKTGITQQWGIPCPATCLSIIPACVMGPYLLLLSHAAHNDHTTHTRATEGHSWTTDPDRCFTLKLSQKPGFQWGLKQLKDGFLREKWSHKGPLQIIECVLFVCKQGLDWHGVWKQTFWFWCLHFLCHFSNISNWTIYMTKMHKVSIFSNRLFFFAFVCSGVYSTNDWWLIRSVTILVNISNLNSIQ